MYQEQGCLTLPCQDQLLYTFLGDEINPEMLSADREHALNAAALKDAYGLRMLILQRW